MLRFADNRNFDGGYHGRNLVWRSVHSFGLSLAGSCRRGLTLLELLVVLTILIALGGIVVASLPGLLERTQAATAAANVPEIDAAIKRNLLLRQGQIGQDQAHDRQAAT